MSYNSLQSLPVVDAQSKIERLEMLLSYFDHLPVFESRGKYNNNDPRNNVVWVRGFEEDNRYVKEWSFSKNIITVDGRKYYARLAQRNPAFSIPDNENFGSSTFGRFQMANPSTQNPISGSNVNDTWDQFDTPNGAAIAGSIKQFTTNYPMVADPDSDNTGDGDNVVTYQVFYGQSDFTADPTFVKNGCIHAMGSSSPTNSTKLLCHFATPTSTGVQKQSTDTLKVITNHPVSSS